MGQIVVVIEGGAVQSAYTDVDDLDVLIADHDEYHELGLNWKEREAREAEVVKGLNGVQWGLDIPKQHEP